MPEAVWLIAFSLAGIAAYGVPAMVGQMLPIDIRTKVGRYYFKHAIKSFQRLAVVRKRLGGLVLKRYKKDDEKGTGKIEYSTGITGDDKELHFEDRDDRLKRLYSKPLVLLHEDIPTVIDAELAELGYWWRKHVENGRHIDAEGDRVVANPFFRVRNGLRTVELNDTRSLILNGSEPSDVQTTEKYTRKRFEKYGNRLGITETLSVLIGFGVGAGGVFVIKYAKQYLPEGETGGGISNPIDTIGIGAGMIDVTPALDVLMGVF